MTEGAELTWTWEMYGVLSTVWIEEVRAGRLIRFRWDGYDPAHPTTVRFEFTPYPPTCRASCPGREGQDRGMTDEDVGADFAHPARVYDYWLGGRFL